MRNKKIIVRAIIFLLAVLFTSAIANTQVSVPTFISYQGKLTNSSNGDPITTASLKVNITSLNNLSDVVWNFTFNNAVDQYGIFDLVLGRNATLNLIPGRDYQLVVMVDLGSATHATDDVVYGDLSPSGDNIVVNGGGPSDASELLTTDNITTVQAKLNTLTTNISNLDARISALNTTGLTIAVQNDTDVKFVNASISKNLSVSGEVYVGGGYGSTGISMYANGSTSMNGNLRVDGDIYGNGADIAERFEHNDATLAPGDLVIVDPNDNETIMRSFAAYQSNAIGVISTDPSYILNAKSVYGKPVALAGRAPVKATAQNGAIHPGDLLVSSSIPGHVMKFSLLDFFTAKDFGELMTILQENENRRTAIVGTALTNLEQGNGTIVMLMD